MNAFLGRIPGSKSMMNRALVIQSYFPELNIAGDSDCDDVAKLRSGLEDLKQKRPIECGDGGTVFRFLALRASRIPGRHVLTGSARLMSRPHEELMRIFAQLSVKAEFTGTQLILETEGWHPQGDTLGVPSHRSSQFVSSVLLNAWDLPFDLFVSPIGMGVSEGYWRMTQKLVTSLGMKMDTWDHDFRIPAGQKITSHFAVIEPDMSSAFAVAAAAAVSGSATLLEFPRESVQPDFSFVSILSKMGVPISFTQDRLKVQKAHRLNGVAVKLSSAPDLFPVLATLCSLSEGDSELYGAPQLIYKESNRIEKIKELLGVTGRTLEVLPDGLKISGTLAMSDKPFEFNPDHDHRLAMAASLLHFAGAHVKILDADVVNKSYPGYWQAIGWQP